MGGDFHGEQRLARPDPAACGAQGNRLRGGGRLDYPGAPGFREEKMSETFQAVLEQVCQKLDWSLGKDRVEAHFQNDRHQTVHFEFFDFEDQSLVRLFTTIGDATRVDAMRLAHGLRLSFRLPHGALAVRGDDLVMVDTLPVAEAGPETLQNVLRYLAETADSLENSMFGGDEH